ncbi:hypothetical protein MKW98_005124 [Papaver atlanticum]|uniref:Flavin-containing monooxygenase n=1 Tax=Papaver atlanticum TaxID=357466 RepID=A0AAD4RWQ6_9MAGN|nr:hypothetical protein MKW98_005124 [Papaver atlanticum]
MSSPAYGGGDIRRFSNSLVSTMNSRIPSSLTSRNIAVIGAGAAGLVAARELRREGHTTVVFERSNQIGGTWNLWVSEITHKEVLHYLEDFANDSKLIELIRFETEVFHVGLLKDDDKDGEKRVVRSAQKMRGGGGEAVDEVSMVWLFVMGIILSQILLKFQVVFVIGMSASGQDISRDIAEVAKEVHAAGRSLTEGPTKLQGHENMWLHSTIESTHDDGRVAFQDGNSVAADVILHCTGYKYHFALIGFLLSVYPGSIIAFCFQVNPFPLSEL